MVNRLKQVHCFRLFIAILIVLLFHGKKSAVHGDPIINLGPPSSLQPTDDISSPIVLGTTAFRSKIVYATRTTKAPYQSFLVTVETDEKGNTSVVKRAIVTRNIGNDVIFNPQYSPDGQFVLFKAGWPYDRHGSYQLYVWDTQTDKVKWLPLIFNGSPLLLSYPITSWSPDGNYITYIRGGDMYGDIEQGASLFLDIYDWRKDERQFVVENNAVRYGSAWSAPNTLLYSVMSNSKGEGAPSVDIYAIKPKDENPKLIVKNGYRPFPSPDGKHIAFFGPEDENQGFTLGQGWEYIPRGMALSVVDMNGANRKALNSERLTYPQVVWMPDGNRLLSIKRVDASEDELVNDLSKLDNKRLLSQVQVIERDITTGKRVNKGGFKASNFKPIPRVYFQPVFNPLGVSKDGNRLSIFTSEMLGVQEDSSSYIEQITLHILNLESRENSVKLKFKTSLGFDGHISPD